MPIIKFNPRIAMRLVALVVATAALSWQASDAPNLKVADGLRLSLLIRNSSQTSVGQDSKQKLHTDDEYIQKKQIIINALKGLELDFSDPENQWPSLDAIDDKYGKIEWEKTKGKKKKESLLNEFNGYNDLLRHVEFYKSYMLRQMPEKPDAGPASDAEAAQEAYLDANNAGLELNELGKKLNNMDIDAGEYWAGHDKLTAALDKFKKLLYVEGNGLSEADKSNYLTKFKKLGQVAVAEDKLQTKEIVPRGHVGNTF